MWTTNGVIQDAGPALGGPAGANPSEIGITQTGTPFCITDAPITGPYHQLCLGALSAGGGLITYGAFGGAPQLPVNCIINGVTVAGCLQNTNAPCSFAASGLVPATGGGTLKFLRSDCTFNNSLIDSQTSPINAEGAALGVFSQSSITAHQIFSWTQFATPPTAIYDGTRSVVLAPLNSTNTLINAFGGYLQVDENQFGNNTGAAFFGAAAVTRNNGAVWGINTTITDNNAPLAPSAGTGRSFFNEFDMQFTSPNSTGIALQLEGNSVVQPAFAVGVNCSTLAFTPWVTGSPVPAKWNECFATFDAATDTALSIGRSTSINPGVTPQANLHSQLILLGYSNNATTLENVQIYAVSGGAGDNGGGINFANSEGTLVNLNGASYISPDGSVVDQAAFTTGVNTNGGLVNSPSRTSILQYTDGASTRQAVFVKSANDAGNGQLQVSSTAGVAEIFAGKVIANTVFQAGGTVGVTCSGTPTSSCASVGGIVTHC